VAGDFDRQVFAKHELSQKVPAQTPVL